MSGTQPENDGIIPQKSLTVWDGMGKTRNVQKRESAEIKRLGSAVKPPIPPKFLNDSRAHFCDCLIRTLMRHCIVHTKC